MTTASVDMDATDSDHDMGQDSGDEEFVSESLSSSSPPKTKAVPKSKPRGKGAAWTKTEIQALHAAIKTLGLYTEPISKAIGTRTVLSVRSRLAYMRNRAKMPTPPWSPVEMGQIQAAIESVGKLKAITILYDQLKGRDLDVIIAKIYNMAETITKSKAWSTNEFEALRACIKQYGFTDAGKLMAAVPGRSLHDILSRTVITDATKQELLLQVSALARGDAKSTTLLPAKKAAVDAALARSKEEAKAKASAATSGGGVGNVDGGLLRRQKKAAVDAALARSKEETKAKAKEAVDKAKASAATSGSGAGSGSGSGAGSGSSVIPPPISLEKPVSAPTPAAPAPSASTVATVVDAAPPAIPVSVLGKRSRESEGAADDPRAAKRQRVEQTLVPFWDQLDALDTEDKVPFLRVWEGGLAHSCGS